LLVSMMPSDRERLLAKYFLNTPANVQAVSDSTAALSVANLDVGVTTNMLYLHSTADVRAINCDTAPGQCNLGADPEVVAGLGTQLPPKVRYGDPLAVFDNAKLLKLHRKTIRNSHLEKWHGLPQQEMTPSMVWEWKATQLRSYAHPKKFFKTTDGNKFPTHFHVGRVVGGGSLSVGGGCESEAVGTSSRRWKAGKGLLDTLLEDETVQNWTKKRYNEIQETKAAGGKRWYKTKTNRKKSRKF